MSNLRSSVLTAVGVCGLGSACYVTGNLIYTAFDPDTGNSWEWKDLTRWQPSGIAGGIIGISFGLAASFADAGALGYWCSPKNICG